MDEKVMMAAGADAGAEAVEGARRQGQQQEQQKLGLYTAVAARRRRRRGVVVVDVLPVALGAM